MLVVHVELKMALIVKCLGAITALNTVFVVCFLNVIFQPSLVEKITFTFGIHVAKMQQMPVLLGVVLFHVVESGS